MFTVKSLVTRINRDPIAVDQNASAYTAMIFMQKYNAGVLLVIDEKKHIGIITERDLVRKVDIAGNISKFTSVREVMGSLERISCATPNMDLASCLVIMSSNEVDYLPVLQMGKVINIISVMDIVSEIACQQACSLRPFADHVYSVFRSP